MSSARTHGIPAAAAKYYDLVKQSVLPPPSPAVCDPANCADVGADCCAPLSLGEVAACRGGYTAIRTGQPCMVWSEGSFQCCAVPAPPPLPPSPPPPFPLPPKPPLPPHPPAVSRMEMVAAINARFLAGRPSNKVNHAGVLVHLVDKMEDPEKPWLPCPETSRFSEFASAAKRPSLWTAYPVVCSDSQGCCELEADRWSRYLLEC